MSQHDFTHRHVSALGRSMHRLGLACNYGIDEAGLRMGVERGIRYLFWTSLRTGSLRPAMRDVLAKDRASFVLATGPSLGYFAGNVRRGCEKLLRSLQTDYIDVLHLFWLGKTSALTEGTANELLKLKEEGKIKAIGTSIHDRERAGRLARDSIFDLFMLRYNAAHPGAERDVFPHLEVRKPAVVAYTATSWRKLLKRPSGWDGNVMTPGDCYRFCLSSPHVDAVLCGPANSEQLKENLDALDKGPLTADEDTWMRAFGKAVHG